MRCSRGSGNLKRIFRKYGAWICFAIVVILVGCGIKGNPSAPSFVKSSVEAVQNFKAISSPDGVILKWDVSKRDSSIDHMVIERSEVGSPGNECKDCPRTYEKIAEIGAGGKELPQNGDSYKNLSFIDKKVVKGKIYNYRLLICNRKNNCIEGSTAENNF